MTKRNKIVIWLIIIAVAATVFFIWNNQRSQIPQTPEEIQAEIDRLQKTLEQAQEDTQKSESGEVACILVYEPVCGVDGKTYSNDCFAAAAGIEIAYQRECE